MLYQKKVVNNLLESLRLADFLPKDVIKMTEPDILSGLLKVVHKKAEIVGVNDVVFLNAPPFVPDGWSVLEHRVAEPWKYDSRQIKTYLSPKQKQTGNIFGFNLRTELKDVSVLNANALDYMLVHQQDIPEKFKEYYLMFWGTIYKDYNKKPCVRYLMWAMGKWAWDSVLVHSDFYSASPAAHL